MESLNIDDNLFDKKREVINNREPGRHVSNLFTSFSRRCKMQPLRNLNPTFKSWLKLSALLLLFACNGCGRDSDSRVVDFTKTAPAARPAESASDEAPLRVAVGAMVSPKESFIYYRKLLDYMGKKLGNKVELVQRKSYGEINALLGKGQIDFGFICSGPYATGREKLGFELVAIPEIRGSHFYQAYLIVNRNSAFQNLRDLKNRTFAFTDPDSLTGRLVPMQWLVEIHESPESYFDKIIYTYSHDNSILAVAKGLVDGAAVDGLIWEYYQQANPDWTSRTRIIRKSKHYGIPPLVAARTVSPQNREKVGKVLLEMHQDPVGREILQKLMIDRFVIPEEDWYAAISMIQQGLAEFRRDGHASSKP